MNCIKYEQTPEAPRRLESFRAALQNRVAVPLAAVAFAAAGCVGASAAECDDRPSADDRSMMTQPVQENWMVCEGE